MGEVEVGVGVAEVLRKKNIAEAYRGASKLLEKHGLRPPSLKANASEVTISGGSSFLTVLSDGMCALCYVARPPRYLLRTLEKAGIEFYYDEDFDAYCSYSDSCGTLAAALAAILAVGSGRKGESLDLVAEAYQRLYEKVRRR